MRTSAVALTGPAAAAVHGLDGFRDGVWRPMWCTPITGVNGPSVVRTRRWEDPILVGDVLVAPVPVVLRQLGYKLLDRTRTRADACDLIELAVEHALRASVAILEDLRGHRSTRPEASLFNDVMARRDRWEPPTESYAETRAVQRFRSVGLTGLWRQLPVFESGKLLHRVDFVVPFRSGSRRPHVVLPEQGVLVEIDSREFHAKEESFEKDARRNCNYEALGYSWLPVTPGMVDNSMELILRSLAVAFRRAGHEPWFEVPATRTRTSVPKTRTSAARTAPERRFGGSARRRG